MKKLSIIFTLIIGLSQFSIAQIIDSLPYFKQELIIKQTIKPFFKSLTWSTGGDAMVKKLVDPKFKPPTKGWIRDSMFNHLNFYLGQAYTSNNQSKLPEKFNQNITIMRSVFEREAELSIMAFVELPEGPKIKNRGAYDVLRNSLFYPCGLPLFLESKFEDLDRVIGFVISERANGQFFIYPDASKITLCDPGSINDSGKTGPQTEGLLTDDGTLVLLVENFFKSIRENDKKAFMGVWDDDLVRSKVWTDMRPLSNYRKLPEYKSKDLKFESIVVVDLERIVGADQLITWGGDVATFVAVYRLPEGKKASKMRAPSDILNSLVLNGLGLKDLESQDKVVSGTAGFGPMPKNSIILGPIIGTIFHEHQNPQNYITVILHKEKGTNNFNIGMPPTFK